MIKKLLKPLASLRLTVALLLISMVLVVAGTTAQREMGIQDVLKNFFRAPFYAKIYLHYFEPTPKGNAGYLTGNLWFPLPGGTLLIGLLLANLLAAHTVRFKFNRRRIGIILIHFGLILLLVGEICTGLFAVESHMRIDAGGSSDFSSDIRDGHGELAFVDGSPSDHDNVVVVPENVLIKAAETKETIHDARLPVEVKVERWYDNAVTRGPMEQPTEKEPIDRRADAGGLRALGLTAVPRYTATESLSNMPAAFVTFSHAGKNLGTYLVSAQYDPVIGTEARPQTLLVDGKPYLVSLRFQRYYKPYTVYLKKFTHDRFAGTDTPRDFASEVRIVDQAAHVDREVRIWMNHPLRFAPTGEVFYQADFDHTRDQFTILQVVHNPAWTMPYVACAIGALGMLLHFGRMLVEFLRRRAAGAASAATTSIKSGPRPDQYTLPAKHGGKLAWIAGGLTSALAIIIVVSRALAPAPSAAGSYDFAAFGRIPIQFEGRTQPLASLARNSVQIISGRTTPKDKDDQPRPAEQWLLDVMTKSPAFAQYKVFRIDHPQIKQMLGLPENEKMFSWDAIFHEPDSFKKIDEQVGLAADKNEKERESYDNQILDLKQRLNILLRLFQVDAVSARYETMRDPTATRAVFELLNEALRSADPDIQQHLKAVPPDQQDELLRRTLSRIDWDKLPDAQRQAIAIWADQTQRTRMLSSMTPAIDLYMVPPTTAGQPWQPLRSVIESANAPDVAAATLLSIFKDYASQKPEDFNADLVKYQSILEHKLPDAMSRMDTELFFNRFDPFTLCMVFYVLVFVFALIYWLGVRPAWSAAYSLLFVTWMLHTAGLVLRIYISGRPPVTNLYSSAVFIAWGLVTFAVVLESIFKNGLAVAMASIAGFSSLLVAAGLASTEGDTMKQLQAVLDTNFWLATHVVCVTLGYTATFLAGVLAIGYVLSAPAVAALRSTVGKLGGHTSNLVIKPEGLKEMARMVYAIVCFAILFSFVGTILGGIWADQSWGRFWGWDPKENGAVLIVLWNAVILHARWGGIVRERGVMVLAILGNVVTSWSWFGTNMLGIGLHSYGFMESAQFALIAFMASQVALAIVGMISTSFWTRMGGPPLAPRAA